jgi:hypothetical protein
MDSPGHPFARIGHSPYADNAIGATGGRWRDDVPAGEPPVRSGGEH